MAWLHQLWMFLAIDLISSLLFLKEKDRPPRLLRQVIGQVDCIDVHGTSYPHTEATTHINAPNMRLLHIFIQSFGKLLPLMLKTKCNLSATSQRQRQVLKMLLEMKIFLKHTLPPSTFKWFTLFRSKNIYFSPLWVEAHVLNALPQ